MNRVLIEAALQKHLVWVDRYKAELAMMDGEPVPVASADARATKIHQHAAAMVKLRCDGKLLKEIGQMYSLTRERVRQIINKARRTVPEYDELMRAAGFTAKHVRHNSQKRKVKPKSLHLAILRWLKSCGYQWCWRCRQAKVFDDYMPSFRGKNGYICRLCNTERMLESRNSNPDLRKRQYEWQRTSPKFKESVKRYQEKHREEIRERRRRTWLAIKSDPERLAKFNRQCAESKRRRMADPVKRAHLQELARQKYQRKKSAATQKSAVA